MNLPLGRAAAAASRDRDDAEARFARRVVRVLDASSRALPAATVERLAVARKTALRAHRVAPVAAHAPVVAHAGTGAADSGRSRLGLGRAGLIASTLLAVGICLAGLFQLEQQQRIEDLADLDAAVLNDDLPISAIADHGFNAFLKQNP